MRDHFDGNLEVVVQEGDYCSHDDISERLQQLYPDTRRGLSARSVRRYCKENVLTQVMDEELDESVSTAIAEVYIIL